MTFDPFADVPADNDPAKEVTPVDTVTELAPAMPADVASTANKVRVTLKAGSGYDAPWITVNGANVADTIDQFSDIDAVKQLVATTVSAAKFFHTSFGGTSTRSSGSGQKRQQPGKPATATQHPNGKRTFCEHGERVFKSGIGKNGKTWLAFDCPQGECDREWDNSAK